MGKFIYMAQDGKGDVTKGVMDAANEGEAIGVLQKQGLFILSISAEKDESRAASLLDMSGGVSGRDLMFFSGQLATLLSGGIPLVRALNLLGERSKSPRLRAALAAVTKDVAGGVSLNKALGRHPAVFDPLFLSLIQAGEVGGQLPKVLRQLSSYLTSQEEMRNKVITALAYPAILVVISLGVLGFFIVKIVPTFAEIFKSFGLELPAMTRAIVFFSGLLMHHAPSLLLSLAGAGLMYKSFMMTDAGKLVRSKFQLRVPVFGEFISNVLVERLLTTMSTLIASGVSILNAFTVLEGLFTENLVFLNALRSVRQDVACGKSISASLKKSEAFDPLVADMVWMGEESGKLPEMLDTLSSFYREQIEHFIRRFSAVIDPIMVVIIGGAVGAIVLAVFMPIFQLSQIGGR